MIKIIFEKGWFRYWLRKIYANQTFSKNVKIKNGEKVKLEKVCLKGERGGLYPSKGFLYFAFFFFFFFKF